MSVLEKLKALDEQRALLLEGAKAEVLANVHKAIAQLGELGFHYNLVEGASLTKATNTPRAENQRKRRQRDIPCPICGFRTSPPHDRRAHRSQEPKRPFTDAELAEKSMIKID